MQITALPQLYRNLNRLREILTILSKYGLADWLSKLDIDFFRNWLRDGQGSDLMESSRAQRIRLVLTELGPTFIKLGQILSTRPDLLGSELASELQQLQSNVPADPPEEIKAKVEKELGCSIDEVFSSFDDKALASASIGQVHRAALRDGSKVVVKVQHIGIQSKVREDLEILTEIASLMAQIEDFAVYQPVATVAEFKRSLERELDFQWELRNLQLFKRHFQKNNKIKIPEAYPAQSTSQVLTMECLEGTPLNSKEALKAGGFDLVGIAEEGAQLFLTMIFTHGVFHADPHPGNFYLMPDNKIGLIDFGMVGRLSGRMREDIEDMLLSLVQRDSYTLTSSIMRMGRVPPSTDTEELSADVNDFISFYATQSVEDLDIGAALNEMMEIVRRYHIVLPPQIGMLIKVLVTLEGTSRLLSPEFNLIGVMAPFQVEIVKRRISPERYLRRIRRLYDELGRIAELLPSQVLSTLEKMQSGQFELTLEHKHLPTSLNRLVWAMLTASLFLGSSIMISAKAGPMVPWIPFISSAAKVSLFGILGLTLSAVLGFRLWLSLRRTGHLDHSKS